MATRDDDVSRYRFSWTEEYTCGGIRCVALRCVAGCSGFLWSSYRLLRQCNVAGSKQQQSVVFVFTAIVIIILACLLACPPAFLYVCISCLFLVLSCPSGYGYVNVCVCALPSFLPFLPFRSELFSFSFFLWGYPFKSPRSELLRVDRRSRVPK
ncbi:hypothetical protein EDC01DRAFT_13053 [Geopyxis carbonaria]|nr:hypothetical protein EDC01DRAFT_13053 [Geopyxis carbonaria]